MYATILWFVGGVVMALTGIVLAIGAALPREHIATGSIHVPMSAEKIWQDVRNVSMLSSWRPTITGVECLAGPEDAPTSWIEHSGGNAIKLKVEQSEAPQKLETRIDDPNLPFGGTWTIELRPAADGTQVRITEHGFVKSPLFRFVAKFLIGHSSTLRNYLRDLGAKYGASTNIEP